MTLEFEKLTTDLEVMAQTTARRKLLQQERAADARATLDKFATNWTAVSQALQTAQERSDKKHYRSARPFNETEALNTRIPAPPPPDAATIISVDGSQIMPDRHAAYLYYLINVGGIVYHHGRPQQPDIFSIPEIFYPEEDATLDNFNSNSGEVSIERDKAEITMLAKESFALRHATRPLISILDQRLFYWPIDATGTANNTAVHTWTRQMTKIHDADAYLCGYIDRPGTIAVTTLLRTIQGMDDPEFDWKELGKRKITGGLTDADLFREILQPGERSKIFVNVSQAHDAFMENDKANEVCFFYFNPSSFGRDIARVDIPRWVAEDVDAVTAVHGLIYSQCQVLGNYPYVLARAHEMAVVGRRDASELNFMIDVIMERHGLSSEITSKQSSKELTGSSKTRFEI